jgi:hypothetical protein
VNNSVIKNLATRAQVALENVVTVHWHCLPCVRRPRLPGPRLRADARLPRSYRIGHDIENDDQGNKVTLGAAARYTVDVPHSHPAGKRNRDFDPRGQLATASTDPPTNLLFR